MNHGSTGGIVATSILIILALLGIHEEGGLEGAKQYILASLEILR